MRKIGVIFIADNLFLIEDIMEILKQQSDIEIIAVLQKSRKVMTKLYDLKPDVLILGHGPEIQNSLMLMKSVKKKCPEIKVIVMDIIPIQEDILKYVEAGVSGFILKDVTGDVFLKTIRSVANEEKVLPSNLTGSLFSQIVDNEVNLLETSKAIQVLTMTELEREIVLLIADGLSHNEIAKKLHLSNHSVKSHFDNLLKKMILNTLIQLDIYALPGETINTTTRSITPKN